MKRLTKRRSNGEAMLDCDNCELQQSYECGEILCRDRLRNRVAAYEDTGLSPESVEALKLSMMGKALTEIKEFNGVPLARLRELAEADKAGRVAVLPCKPGDMLYEVTSRKTISEYRVTAICVTLGGFFLEWEIKRGFAGRSAIGIIPDWIGKTVFLTRAEAEKALQQMEGENGIENPKSYSKKDAPDGALRQ